MKATDYCTAERPRYITGTQSGIVVQPAGAVSPAVTGRYPKSTEATDSTSRNRFANFVVTAFDPYGNVATGYALSGTVRAFHQL